jgi:hypothetical protein
VSVDDPGFASGANDEKAEICVASPMRTHVHAREGRRRNPRFDWLFHRKREKMIGQAIWSIDKVIYID